MLKQGSFINKQFNKVLLGGLLGGLAYAINLMIDSIVSGNQLGEVALEAVSIVYPLYAVVGVFSYLLPLGTSILFGKAIGEFKKDEAYRTAGTGLVASVLISVSFAVVLWAIKMPFLHYYECTGELLANASAYYNWVIACALVNPVGCLLYYLTITDGESVFYSMGNLVGFLENMIMSVVLAKHLGIQGLGMATFFYILLSNGCYAAHLLKKSNNVKFHLCLDFRILRRALVLSLSDYMYDLFLAVVDIVLNKIIIANCGMEYIPAYSVVNLAFSLCEVFIIVNNASMGLVTCFLGERNNHDMSLVFRQIRRAILSISLALTLLLFFGAPLMPVIYGLENPVTVQAAIFASRLMAFATLGFGACYVGGSISSAVEHPVQACFISFLNDVCSPLLLSLIFGTMLGFKGIVIGMCLSSYFSIVIYTIVSLIKNGKTGFPMYVKDFGGTATSYDLYITPESMTEVRDAVKANLEANGFDVRNVDLLMEEFFTRVMEKNPGKKVLSECTLLYQEDTVRIIVRDNGILFNFIDENNTTDSINAQVLSSLLEQTKENEYLQTTSFNRSGFLFHKPTG